MRRIKPIVLILCGGRSLRLWPLSEKTSKNFLDVFGFSPLELTVKRFLKITTADNIFLVANKREKKALSGLKLVKEKNIFFEPASKNTAAAVLLSLYRLKGRCRENLIISPVDTLISNQNDFRRSLNRALAAARGGWICTLGIKPTSPTSNFGYIRVHPVRSIRRRGEKNRTSNGVEKPALGGIFSVSKFIEKPPAAQAKKLIASGNCFYNSGMFVAPVATLLEEYKRYYPHYGYFFRSLDNGKITALYKRIPDVPFDKVIMEKTGKARLVKAGFPWIDFGSWQAIYEVLTKDKEGNAIRGNSLIWEGENNLVYLENLRKKALILGLKEVFFVDTKNFTLLADRAHLDRLKTALKRFKGCR